MDEQINERIEVEHFDKCVLLTFGSVLFNEPLRQVKTSTSRGWEYDVINYVEMNAEDGNEIIQLINNLPYGEPSRCHNPRFGVELLEDENQVFVCSICWQCNNIFTMNKGISSGLHFDSLSAEASLLLDKFRFAFNAIVEPEDA